MVKCDVYDCKKQAVKGFKYCPKDLADSIDNLFQE